MTTIIKQANSRTPSSPSSPSSPYDNCIPTHLSHIRSYNPDITHDTHATRNRSHRLISQREHTDNQMARVFQYATTPAITIPTITHFPSATYHKHIPTFSEQSNTTNTSYTRLSAAPTPPPRQYIHRTERQKCFLYTLNTDTNKPTLQHYGVFTVEIREIPDATDTTLTYTLHRADRTLPVSLLHPSEIPPLPPHLPYSYADLLRYKIHFYLA